MAEVVVFDIDAQSAIQKLAELRASTAELKKAQAELAKEVKDGNAEAAKVYEANAILLKNVANEQRVLSRQVEGYSQVQKNNTNTINFANNSIQQNRDLLKQLTAQYINLKNPPKEATEQIKKLSDTLKSQEEAIGDTRRNVGNYKDALEGLPGGLGKAIGGIRGFNAALTANPIGAVVQLVTFLTTAFQKNAVIADQVTFAFDALNKGFQFIIDTVVNTVSSFDNLQKAITNPIKFIKELATGTAQAAKDGFNASKAFDEFTVTQAKLNQQIQINEKRVEALTKSLKDRTKSEKERIAIANEAADLEIAGFKIKEDLAKQELANEQLKLKGKKLSAEEEAKIIELQTKVFIAGEEQKTTAAQRQTRINILLQKEITNNLKAETDKRIQLITNEFETYDDFEKKIKKIEDASKAAQEGAFKFLQTIYEPEEFFEEGQDAFDRILSNFEKFKLGLIDTVSEKDIIGELTGLDEKGVENVIGSVQVITGAVQGLNDIIGQSIANRQDQLQQAFESGKISEEEFNRQTKELALKEFRRQKAFNLVQATMDTIKGAISAYASTPGGPIIKGIAAAIATTFGVAQTAVIAAQQPPKFAEGGEISIDGKSHAQGGEIVTVGGRPVAEVEGGEGLYVMKKNAYQKIKQFSAINEAFGGKSWLNGSSKFLADGGAINTTLPILESRGRVNNTIEQNRILSEALRQLPAPVLSIKEFEKKQAVKDKSVRIAEL
jgi:hypothetical protein